MKIAYFSPLPPLKTGIADYSAELLTVLQKYMQIDLFVDNFRVSEHIARNFRIHNILDAEKIIKQKNYDMLIYHIGNNEIYHSSIYQTALKYPGIVVLHDFAIHHLLAQLTYVKGLKDKYVEEMQYNHGEEGRKTAIDFIEGCAPPPWGSNAINFPMNKRLIESARGVIVHSFYSRHKVKNVKKDVPVKVIHMHCLDICENEKKEKMIARSKLGINHEQFVLASFGFINSSKRIDKVLIALKRLKEISKKEIKYILVGEQNEAEYPLNKIICNLGLQDTVVFAGFAEMELYKDFMKAADICINLRFPYYGETSANLHRMLGMGKVVLVSDIGSFSEYPDDVVFKVSISSEEDDIYRSLFELLHNNELRPQYSINALNFAKNYCHLENSAKKYLDFIDSINKDYYRAEGIVEDIAQCLFEMGIDDRNDILIRNLSRDIAQILY